MAKKKKDEQISPRQEMKNQKEKLQELIQKMPMVGMEEDLKK
jgi:hypothetical protein